VLLVVSALLKCAQLPLHGWLIQVMEAPTPVSALLHAGVVNLGGFVLIRFAPLLAQAPVALALLATVATLTVVLATLVMGTRISIKVALAWSTVAQMGFMLLQVALGLPAMALLHLVAHSLYKAHAFLGAGGVVQRRQALRLAPAAVPSAARWALAGVAAPALVVGVGVAAGALATPAAALAGAVLGLALVPLAAAGRVGAAGAVALGWFAGHAVASGLVVPATFAVAPALVVSVAAALAALFALQAAVALRPGGPLARRLYPWAYGGFYVDERISRTLLARWPVPAAPAPHPSSTFAGAR
jgi:NAD(P)H-quinone oxidoreductase subunit 5